jgi:ribosomal protein S18 acetylase RimI-like enzyme
MTRSDVRNPAHYSPDLSGSDWRVLRGAILKSLTTSPDAFLATLEQIKHQPAEFWQYKLVSATWAVVQHGSEVFGIAAAKMPADTDDYALPERARFIESVWVAPELRRRGVAQRLLTYLIDQQRQAGIQEFYLWVLNHNNPAAQLYDTMGFKQEVRSSLYPETQFLLRFDSDVVDDEELDVKGQLRAGDDRTLGITYRLLSA